MTHLEPEFFNHSQQRQAHSAPVDLVSQWANMGYTLPKEEVDGSQTHIKGKYKPRTSDLPGIAVAITVIGAWALVFWHAMFRVRLPWDKVGHLTDGSNVQGSSSYLHIAVVFFALEFLYTGLFITTHDAMHGTIAMRHRRLNDFLGWVAISLYAWFDYDMLHRKHWEHHNNTGVVGMDPDFHRGNPGLLPWYLRFMAEYMTIWQFTRIAWWSVFMTLLGVHEANMLLFMTAAPLVSAFRLFYFGTYLPHHPEPGPEAATKEMSWPLSRTSQTSRIASFFTCYHFDLHWEHHRWPYAAWWDLPKCRELSGRGAAKRRKSTDTDSPVPPTGAPATAPAQHR